MDFFKSCRTNVHQTPNILRTTFTRYEHSRDQMAIYPLLTATREHGGLCATSHNEVWIFGKAMDPISSNIIAQTWGLQVMEQGILETQQLVPTADGRLVKDVLLEAIEGAVAYQLAHVAGMLHVGLRTWLLEGAEEDDGQDGGRVLLRMRLEISDAGTLVATTNTARTSVTACDDGMVLKEGPHAVMLAPSGRNATLLREVGKGVRLIDSEDWKAQVTARLRSEVVEVSAAARWLPVQVSGDSAQLHFAWPAQLCLVSGAAEREAHGKLGSYDWRHYFAASEEVQGFKHPLAVAEDWFTGSTAREKAAQTQEAESTHDTSHVLMSTSIDGDSVLATSPPFNQRTADQQAAMAGIYPTPPDGLVPGQPASQQPSSDNIGGVLASTSHADQSFGTEFLPGGDVTQQRRQTSSSEGPTFHRGSDDLFGDMGGDIDFAGGEVGDEDFDFFNEEGGAASGHQPEDTAMLDDSPAIVRDEVEPHVETTQPVDEPEDALVAQGEMVAETPAVAEEEEEEEEAPREPVDVPHIFDSQPDADRTTTIERHATEPEKPLSPFGIKERLLPPPIPASANSTNVKATLGHRRSSTFEAVHFREGLDLGRRFSSMYGPADNLDGVPDRHAPVDISLPPKRKKPRVKRPPDQDSEASDIGSESEEDSYESASSVSDQDLPPKTPWETKKRKRSEYEAMVQSGELRGMLGDEDSGDEEMVAVSGEEMEAALGRILMRDERDNAPSPFEDRARRSNTDNDRLLPVEEVLRLSKLDLVYAAQLVSEQAVSCIPSITKSLDILATEYNPMNAAASAIQRLSDQVLERLLPDTVSCDISKLALVREPPNRAMSAATARPGQPRPPPQRSESVILGPDILQIPPPYMRVQRGNDTYEMLPPALDFWETLSLTPANGMKDIRAFCVFPLNEDLQRLVDSFLGELGGAYESSKLGSHVHIRNVEEDNELDEFEDGLAPVELGEEESVEGALRAYADACTRLGSFLATIAHLEAERTIMIYILNPFPHATVQQHLCACFWLLCKAYRDRISKAQRGQPRSDIVLQILPAGLVASPDTLVTPDAKQLGALAKEVYDRCPPASSSDQDMTSALPNCAAPFVELASPPPKRIGFQLSAEPPSDLLHEGSSLHMAYALSEDGQWMTAAWTDSTGRYQSSTSFCLCGRTFADVAGEAWERTRELLAAREVTWRVLIVTSAIVDESIKTFWRKVIERPRKQPFSVTLLSAELDPNLKLTPPFSMVEDGAAGGAPSGAGFLTPGSTPQATAMTVSPDTSGNIAPPTPAPSDSAAVVVESDPDAHLVDLKDDTWGVLLSSTSMAAPSKSAGGLAHGALFKRGEAGLEAAKPGIHLPCLGLSLLWTVQVRPNGNVDEGNVKQSEMTLREVLKIYRSLSVLTRARNLDAAGEAVPVHLLAAMKGAQALSGFL